MKQKANIEMFKLIFEKSPLATQVMSPEGNYIYINQAFTDIWKLTIEDLKSVNLFDNNIINRDYILPYVKRAFQGESIILPPVLINTPSHQIDKIWIRTLMYSVQNEEEEISYIVMIHEDVTKSQLTSLELIEAQRKADTLLSNLPGMSYQCLDNEDWTMFLVSSGCMSLTGYKPEELIESSVVSYASIIHPEDRQDVYNTIQRHNAKHEYFELEYRIITKDNKIKWVSEKGIMIRDNEGENGILEGFISDITEKKLNRKILEDNEELLNSLIDTLPVYIWLKDVNGVYLTCNHYFELFYGASRNDIIGKTDYDFVPKELADFFRQKDKEALEKGCENTNEEEVTLSENGKKILLETTKKPMFDSQGNLVGVLGIGNDITEKKKTEIDLLEKQQQILSIFEDPNTFLGTLNIDGILINCNDTALNFIGKTLSDLRDIPFWDTPWWTHDTQQRDKLIESFKKALKGIPCGFETYHVGVNNEVVYINFSLRPIRDTNGMVYRFLVEGQNITERKLAEEALTESEER
ncbi:MAG: PAS domain S-box protein, partial [Candidatus Cloacimonetes bacterium]|nr:PAS domain S-box protein [Candidatus Cloacimonadota bacterium]